MANSGRSEFPETSLPEITDIGIKQLFSLFILKLETVGFSKTSENHPSTVWRQQRVD